RATLPAVARWLADRRGDRILTASFADGIPVERSLVRHALCELCALCVDAPAPGFDDRPLPLSVLGPMLERFADDRFGIGPVEPTPEGKRPSEAGLPFIALSRFSFPRPAEVRGKQTNWSHGAAGSP